MNWQCSPVLQPHILHRMTDPREGGMGFCWNKDFVTGAQPPPLAGFAEVSLHKLHLSSGAAPPSAPAKGKRTLVKAAGKGKVKSDLLNLLGSRMRNQTHSAGDSIGSTEEKGPRNIPEQPQADRETWGRMSRPPSLTPILLFLSGSSMFFPSHRLWELSHYYKIRNYFMERRNNEMICISQAIRLSSLAHWNFHLSRSPY